MTNKKTFFALILSAVMCVPFTANAQVTIGSGDAPRATLDVRANDGIYHGIIPPQVSRAQLNETFFPNALRGAIVYVENLGGEAMDQTEHVTDIGLHVFDGLMWLPIGKTYTGSASINITAGNQIQRAALTGDVTAPANSNVTTIADNAVTTRTIAPNAVSNAEIASNAVNTRTIASRAVTGAELFSSNTANRVLAVVGAGTNPRYEQVVNAMIADNTIEATKLTGTGSERGQVLTSTGAGTSPVWQTPPYTEYAWITRGSRWSFEARDYHKGGVFLLIVNSPNAIRIRIRNNNGTRHMASFGTSGFVTLDETWRNVPLGMHMIAAFPGAGALYIESTQPLDPNIVVANILRLR